MYVCMYVYIYIYIHIFIHIYIDMSAPIDACVCTVHATKLYRCDSIPVLKTMVALHHYIRLANHITLSLKSCHVMFNLAVSH